jgi:chemotaxis-related protein WspB
MLLISFNIGKERYALKSGMVVEITPIVELTSIPLAERYIAGIFNYRGTPIPVIDLCELYKGHASKTQMSTRIIIIRYKGKNEHTNLLGLIAERVTESLNDENLEFMDTGIQIANAPFLGPVANDEHGMIQMVDTEQLLPDSVAETLFTELTTTVA